jgi:hypothetical protein
VTRIFLTAACCLVFCSLSQARIGSTMRQAQTEYGSNGAYATADHSEVIWRSSGGSSVEYYNTAGYCYRVVYTLAPGDFFTEQNKREKLLLNLPSGVGWVHDDSTPFTETWHSTDYVVEGFAVRLAARLFISNLSVDHPVDPNMIPRATSTYSLSIEVTQ